MQLKLRDHKKIIYVEPRTQNLIRRIIRVLVKMKTHYITQNKERLFCCFWFRLILLETLPEMRSQSLLLSWLRLNFILVSICLVLDLAEVCQSHFSPVWLPSVPQVEPQHSSTVEKSSTSGAPGRSPAPSSQWGSSSRTWAQICKCICFLVVFVYIVKIKVVFTLILHLYFHLWDPRTKFVQN